MTNLQKCDLLFLLPASQRETTASSVMWSLLNQPVHKILRCGQQTHIFPITFIHSANLATCQGKQFAHFLDARDTGKREQRLLLGLQRERYEKQFHLKDSIEVSSSILCFCGIPQMLGQVRDLDNTAHPLTIGTHGLFRLHFFTRTKQIIEPFAVAGNSFQFKKFCFNRQHRLLLIASFSPHSMTATRDSRTCVFKVLAWNNTQKSINIAENSPLTSAKLPSCKNLCKISRSWRDLPSLIHDISF